MSNTPSADLRTKLILATGEAFYGAALNPDLPQNECLRLLNVADDIDGVIQSLIVKTSTSNRGYETRDLPAEEREALKQFKHGLKILRALHGPQAG